MTHRYDKIMKAFYAGSFDPFTKGHADIVERGLKIFDRIVVGVGINKEKTRDKESADRVREIAALFAEDKRVEVVEYSGLTVSAAHDAGADVLLRGVRDITDFSYESNLAEINRRISGMETVLLTARPELAFISSSMVRELRHFGFPTDEFLPR